MKVFKNNNKDAEKWFSSGGYTDYQNSLRRAGDGQNATLAVHVEPRQTSTGSGGGSYGGGGYDAAYAASQQAMAAMQESYRQQQQAQQEAYERQAQLLREQYERQRAAESEARAKQQAAALSGRDALLSAAQGNYDAAQALRQQGYDANVGKVNADTEAALQQAYINHQLQQRNLGQQMAAAGRSGGAAESTLLGLANAYGARRGQLDNGRAENLAALGRQLEEGKAQDLQGLNDLRAKYESDYQNRLLELESAGLDRLLGYDNDYTAAMTGLEQAKAQQLAQIAQQQAAAQAQMAQQMASLRASASGGSGSGYSRQAALRDQIEDAKIGDMPYDEVIHSRAKLINRFGEDGYEDIVAAAYEHDFGANNRVYGG